MSGKVFYTSENGSINLVAGTVSSLLEGEGEYKGRVVNVGISIDIHDNTTKSSHSNYLYIALWNSNEPGGKMLADHAKHAIKVGSLYTFLTGPLNEERRTDDGTKVLSAYATDFQSNYRWVFNEGKDNELNVVIGPVRTIRSTGENYEVGIPVDVPAANTASGKQDVIWYNVGFKNHGQFLNADNARRLLEKGTICALHAGKLKINEWKDRTYRNMYGFDIVVRSQTGAKDAPVRKEITEPIKTGSSGPVKTESTAPATVENAEPTRQENTLYPSGSPVEQTIPVRSTADTDAYMSRDVFISHSSKDKQAADAICHSLENRGIKCWIAPRDVNPGFEYAEELIKGIKNCKIFLLVYSGNSNVSRPVSKEIESAFRYEKTVIPFRIENVQMRESLEYYLSNLHWLDAFPDDKGFDALAKVVQNTLAAITGSAPAASSSPTAAPESTAQKGEYSTPEEKTIQSNEDDSSAVQESAKEEKPVVELNADEKQLFEILKKRRNEIATEQKAPSYTVLYNSTLEEMCLKLPATIDEFLMISGVGQRKADAYGEQFLDLIAKNANYTPRETFSVKQVTAKKQASEKKQEAPTKEFIASEVETTKLDAVSKVATRINIVLAECGYKKKLSAQKINLWLISTGYLEETEENGEMTKTPTAKGDELGIKREKRTYENDIEKYFNYYTKSAQEFIISNALEILNLS